MKPLILRLFVSGILAFVVLPQNHRYSHPIFSKAHQIDSSNNLLFYSLSISNESPQLHLPLLMRNLLSRKTIRLAFHLNFYLRLNILRLMTPLICLLYKIQVQLLCIQDVPVHILVQNHYEFLKLLMEQNFLLVYKTKVIAHNLVWMIFVIKIN